MTPRTTHRQVAPTSRHDAPVRHHAVLRLLAGAVGLAVVALVLWWSGKALPPPSSLDERALTDWLGGTDPVVAAFAVVRLAGLALAMWITLTGAVSLFVHLSRLRRIRWLRRLIDRLCLPVVRRLVHGVAGVTLAAAAMAPGAAGALPATATSTALLRPDSATILAIDAPPATGTSFIAGDRAVLVSLDSADPERLSSIGGSTEIAAPPATAVMPAPPAPAGTPTAPAPTAVDPVRVADTWVIRSGDHLWYVAQTTLRDRIGVAPSDDDVSSYLAELIEANRDRLLVPANPDLVFAGQVIALPAASTSLLR